MKQIQAGLSLLVLVALLSAWSGQIAHLLLVPHHYCFAHDEISHEIEHHEAVTGWLASEVENDDHCAILATFLRSGTLTAAVVFAETKIGESDTRIEFNSVARYVTDLFLLAPKNSPPVQA